MPENDNMTRSATREIIENFSNEIQIRLRRDAKPSKEIVFFRDEHIENKEREVVKVPTNLLRFRKDNGRILSDVISYQKDSGVLKEKSKEAQEILRDFLLNKDPEKTTELINSIKHIGQREPAIITCDGFLINGNRRKVAIDLLFEKTGKEKYSTMKVVILPNVGEEGGPPTLKEIEEIENRYQLQSGGRSEYTRFDKALSMRRKMNNGMSLREQLKDDPQYVNCSQKELNKEINKLEKEYLKPLECVDDYLSILGRDGLYSTVSSSAGDRMGRWEAFIDYYARVKKYLENPNRRIQMGIDENEIGDIEEIAFKIIRKREFPKLPKVHMLMRQLPKMLENKHAKKELVKLLDIELELETEECFDENGNEKDEKEKDLIWGQKHATTLIRQVKEAKKIIDYETEREKPMDLLRASLAKLEHENMDPSALDPSEYKNAMKLSKQIKDTANELESIFFRLIKEWKKQLNKLKNNFN